MNKIIVIFASCVFAFGCGTTSPTNGTANNAANKTNTVNTATPSPANMANASNAAAPATGLSSLKASVGKTAFDIKLWENKDVNPRLEKLLGADYAAMKKYWNTETPIEAEGDVLMLTGCERHNCGDNQYVIFIDIAKDNINAHHFLKDTLKSYKEKGEITLPKGFADEFASMKSSSAIK